MNALLMYLIVLCFSVGVWCLDRGAPCVTPNSENAICSSYDDCEVIRKALLTGNETVQAFAKKSACGFDNEPLICCGSTAFPVEKPIQTNVLPDRSECGWEKKDNRVFGGEITEIGEFPWMVLLGYTSNFSDEIEYKCGGTLINNRYVLTAAHCVLARRRVGLALASVRLGEWRVSTEEDCNEDVINEECADPVTDLKVEQRIPHMSYSKKKGTDDIALVRLERNIRYTDYIRPICLPTTSVTPQDSSSFIVSGWGTTENGSLSDVKLKLEVPVVPNAECAEKVGTRGEITENQVCAGGDKGKDACTGDSGGPLMGTFEKRSTTASENHWYQEGVISWGVGCGRDGFPGVYTKVSKYMAWIMNNIS